MEDLFETIIDLKKTGEEPAALAIIIKTKGSTLRRAGAKMVVLKDWTLAEKSLRRLPLASLPK
jgi:xanthine/CO dehydrogenase XdhC/CoxF family maturation factor